MGAKFLALFVLVFAGISVSPGQSLPRISSQSFQRGVNGGATCVGKYFFLNYNVYIYILRIAQLAHFCEGLLSCNDSSIHFIAWTRYIDTHVYVNV